jgi:hypothetical protein
MLWSARSRRWSVEGGKPSRRENSAYVFSPRRSRRNLPSWRSSGPLTYQACPSAHSGCGIFLQICVYEQSETCAGLPLVKAHPSSPPRVNPRDSFFERGILPEHENYMNKSILSKVRSMKTVSSLAAIVLFSAVLSITIAQPTPGNYPNTTVPLSGDATVTPDATPAETTSINVSTDTNFKGTFAASPTTGVVTVTDAHPAGTTP